MKCRIHKCKAACCYNVQFVNGELEKYADKIVNPVLFVDDFMFGTPLPFTTQNGMQDNKCPFLRTDCRCNIYENRPDICRRFGQIDDLQCNYLKK